MKTMTFYRFGDWWNDNPETLDINNVRICRPELKRLIEIPKTAKKIHIKASIRKPASLNNCLIVRILHLRHGFIEIPPQGRIKRRRKILLWDETQRFLESAFGSETIYLSFEWS